MDSGTKELEPNSSTKKETGTDYSMWRARWRGLGPIDLQIFTLFCAEEGFSTDLRIGGSKARQSCDGISEIGYPSSQTFVFSMWTGHSCHPSNIPTKKIRQLEYYRISVSLGSPVSSQRSMKEDVSHKLPICEQ